LIDWDVTPPLAVFQLYRGVNKYHSDTEVKFKTERTPFQLRFTILQSQGRVHHPHMIN